MNYTKTLGISAIVSLASCTKEAAKIPAENNSANKLISILERGDRQAIRLLNVPPETKVLKAKEIWKYSKSDTIGQIFYKVYEGKADKDIRKTLNKEGTLVTVGQGVTRLNKITLSNGQKAYKGDYISQDMADSLFNVSIQEKDSIFKSKITDSLYNKLKPNEHDAIISYLYNVNEKLLCKAPKGKSFFQYLCEGNKGMVQSKFNVEPSAESARAGIAKRNLINMIIFGNGKIYNDKAAQNNFEKQVKIIASHKKGASLLEEAIDITKKYGVDSLNLKETKQRINNIVNK